MHKGNVIDIRTHQLPFEAQKNDISEELKLAIEELIVRLREMGPLDVSGCWTGHPKP